MEGRETISVKERNSVFLPLYKVFVNYAKYVFNEEIITILEM